MNSPQSKNKKHLLCGKKYSMVELEIITGMTRQYILKLLRDVKRGTRTERELLTIKDQHKGNKQGRPRMNGIVQGINTGLTEDRIQRLADIPNNGSWETKHIHPKGIVTVGSGRSDFAKCHL